MTTFPNVDTQVGGSYMVILIERDKSNTKLYSKGQYRNFAYNM